MISSVSQGRRVAAQAKKPLWAKILSSLPGKASK
jgi:hypothetical protein